MAKVLKMNLDPQMLIAVAGGAVVGNVVDKALSKKNLFKLPLDNDAEMMLTKNKLKLGLQKSIPILTGIACIVLSKKYKQPLLLSFGSGMVAIGASNVAIPLLKIGGVANRMVLGTGNRIADYVETMPIMGTQKIITI
jgi:hypothetical protein